MDWVNCNQASRQARREFKVAAFVIFLLIFLGIPRAFADQFNSETLPSVRGLGMGDAVVNLSRGGNSVFYNPANIAAKKTGENLQLVNVQADLNQGLVSQVANGRTFMFTQLSKLYPDLVKNPNTYVGGRFAIFPNITFRNFSIGMLYELDQGAEYEGGTGSLLVRARDRFAPTAALSYRFFSGILRLGACAQYLTVGNADVTKGQPITASSLDYKNFINAGSGLSLNAGTTLTLPVRFLPSFSVVARDIGNTKLTGRPLIKFGNGSTLPNQPMTFDFAASMRFYLANRLTLKIEGDYRDITNKYRGGRFRHVFLGSELNIYHALHLRVGLAHGYVSYGLGLSTNKAALDAAIYTDELAGRLRGIPDVRYVLQYSYSLFK